MYLLTVNVSLQLRIIIAAMNPANTYSSSVLYLFGLVSFCFVNP